MDQRDRQAIDDLFARLGDVERQAGPRDADAERFIGDRIAGQPAAPYFMAQTVVVQQQALETLQARVAELEGELSRRPAGGGLLGGLFGGGQQREASRGRPMPPPQSQPRAHPQAMPGQGGGFLAGAAQTAVGVAGGMMLGNLLGSMFAGGEAEAAPVDEGMGGDEPMADDGGMFGDSFFGDEEF